MDSFPPSPETTLAIILGASEFPKQRNLMSSQAFLNAAKGFKEYLLNSSGLGMTVDNVLDLFNSEDSAPDMDERVGNFLEERQQKLSEQNHKARDLLVYYVGHGGFSNPGDEYFLAIRKTHSRNEGASSYGIKALANTLRESATHLRRFLIFDSCFAAAAYDSFQSAPLQVAKRQTLLELPPKGTALLCAAGPKDPAKTLPTQLLTMFSEAFLEALRVGDPQIDGKLSFRDVSEITRNLIKTKFPDKAIRPEMLSPDQRHGDLATTPFFPNATQSTKTQIQIDVSENAGATRFQNGLVHVGITSTGEFVGGRAALRRVCADIIDGDWSGQVELDWACLKQLRHEAQRLTDQPGLTPEEARQFEDLRRQIRIIEHDIEVVKLALRLTFVRVPGREPTWGLPMDTERAAAFLEGLFVDAQLAARPAGSTVKCRLYVPKRYDDPIALTVLVHHDEIREVEDAWQTELGPYNTTVWKTWRWPEIIPLWHLPNDFIATNLLPAIAVSIARRVISVTTSTIGAIWEHISKALSSRGPDLLVPNNWCLALRCDSRAKDLAWRSSPPQDRSELEQVIAALSN
jgi:hypothetical protein